MRSANGRQKSQKFVENSTKFNPIRRQKSNPNSRRRRSKFKLIPNLSAVGEQLGKKAVAGRKIHQIGRRKFKTNQQNHKQKINQTGGEKQHQNPQNITKINHTKAAVEKKTQPTKPKQKIQIPQPSPSLQKGIWGWGCPLIRVDN
jgi:hypothetical protein